MLLNLMAAAAMIPVVAKVATYAYSNLREAKLLVYANNVVLKMDGNPVYLAYAKKVTALKETNDAYYISLSLTINGASNNQITKKNELKAAIINCLNAFELDLNRDAAGVPSFITGAGFNCWKKREMSNNTVPPQPTVVSIKADPNTKGCAIVSCSCPSGKGISSVAVYLSLDGLNFSQYTTIGNSGGKVEGLPSGENIYLQIASIGKQGKQSDPTTPTLLMVV